MSQEPKEQLKLNQQKPSEPTPPIPTPTTNAAPAQPVSSRPGRVVTEERLRATINDGSSSRFAVNPDRIPEDVEYRWVRIELKGVEDNDNYDKAVMSGWMEVPASRHPELVIQRIADRGKPIDTAGPIIRSGHILMDLPKIVAVEKREVQRRENIDRIQSIEHTLVDGSPSTFYTEKNQVTMSKGVSFQN